VNNKDIRWCDEKYLSIQHVHIQPVETRNGHRNGNRYSRWSSPARVSFQTAHLDRDLDHWGFWVPFQLLYNLGCITWSGDFQEFRPKKQISHVPPVTADLFLLASYEFSESSSPTNLTITEIGPPILERWEQRVDFLFHFCPCLIRGNCMLIWNYLRHYGGSTIPWTPHTSVCWTSGSEILLSNRKGSCAWTGGIIIAVVAGINEYIEGYGILRCAHDTVGTRECFPLALQFAIGIPNTQLSFNPGSQVSWANLSRRA